MVVLRREVFVPPTYPRPVVIASQDSVGRSHLASWLAKLGWEAAFLVTSSLFLATFTVGLLSIEFKFNYPGISSDLLCESDEYSGVLFKDALVAVNYVGLPPYLGSLIALDIEGQSPQLSCGPRHWRNVT
jgi:hypothetical protein